MKKQIFLVGISLITAISFGQKKEVKKAEKEIAKGNMVEALSYLSEAEAEIGTADSELKAQYYAYKGYALAKTAGKDFKKIDMAIEAMKMAKEQNSKEADNIVAEGSQLISSALVNSAIDDQSAKNYKSAAEKLYKSYNLNKRDTTYLYYAASNALQDEDYDTALNYYNELLTLGYTGKATQYLATDKETGETQSFANKNVRDISVKSGEYLKPEEKITPSQKGEVLRYLTLIYAKQGKDEKALELIASARKENPEDISLIRAEAEMVYKMGDLDKYNLLMKQVIASDPNNPDLYFNLGAAAGELKDTEKAIEYYRKVIELDPTYTSAQINIAALLLEGENDLVKQMNELSTSAADNKKYDALKTQRKKLYLDVTEVLEPAYKTDPTNIDVVRTLMNIYAQTGEDAKMKQMKIKLAELEQ